MLYFIYDKCPASPLKRVEADHKVARQAEMEGMRVVCRHDFGCMAEAKAVAFHAGELTGDEYVATDAGEYCHPRWDVVRAPKVGDEVSYAFNGDYYPDGTISRISKSLRRVVTSTGRVYFRRRLTGAWVNGGTWSMVSGHISEQNPSF